MTDFIQVVTTTDTEEAAKQLAGAVVEKRLAACAQLIGPITSVYWWKGEIQENQEWLVVLKSSRALFGDLQAAVTALHPYDVPEILAIPIADGDQTYLDWLNRELRDSQC